MKILVDTDVLIEFLLGNKAAVKKIENYAGKEELHISSLTLAEISYSISDRELLNDVIEAFPLLYFDDRAALKMNQLLSAMEFEKKVPFRFLFNSSVALANDAVMLAKRRDIYSTIPGLRLI